MNPSDTKGRSKVYRGEPEGEFGHGCESREEHDAELEIGWCLSDAIERLKLCEDAGDLANAQKWKAEVDRINAIPKPDEERLRLAVKREPRDLPALAFELSPEFFVEQRVTPLPDTPILEGGGEDVGDISDADDAMTKSRADTQAQVEGQLAAPVVPMGESNEASWRLKRPERFRGYSLPLYRFLVAAQRECRPRPSARDAVEEWRVKMPAEIAQVLSDGINYYSARGDLKAADLEAIRKAIERMTSGR